MIYNYPISHAMKPLQTFLGLPPKPFYTIKYKFFTFAKPFILFHACVKYKTIVTFVKTSANKTTSFNFSYTFPQ